MKTTLKINCSTDQLSQILSGYCKRWLAENEKPADLVPGRSDQRVPERGSEVTDEATCEGFAGRRDSSTTSITQASHNVKERNNDAH
jgi:hypothetical protein